MGKRKVPENLPGSDAGWFWKDGEKYSGTIETFRPEKECTWVQVGANMAKCVSCPISHGQYLKLGTEVRNGKIVAKRPVQF